MNYIKHILLIIFLFVIADFIKFRFQIGYVGEVNKSDIYSTTTSDVELNLLNTTNYVSALENTKSTILIAHMTNQYDVNIYFKEFQNNLLTGWTHMTLKLNETYSLLSLHSR